MERFYNQVIQDHFKKNRQMLFLMGPRQVGKTTISQMLGKIDDGTFYYNWDDERDREARSIGEARGLASHQKSEPLLIFDEIHKHRGWKLFLKALYDIYPHKAHILVTGSARLDVYQRGGDSLMGRYFLYRINPLSVAELAYPDSIAHGVRPAPARLDDNAFDRLWTYGGFPDPFLKGDPQYYLQWKRLKYQQLFREDLRDLTRVHELSQIELLAKLLSHQVGQQTSYTSLSRKVRVSDQTIRSWLKTLSSLYYSFEVRPYSKNIAKSLVKEPKYYLYDWSLCEDDSARAENMVACHLLKAVHFWTDFGLGEYDLFYLRDKEKREVDFLVTKDGDPYFLVEVKLTDGKKTSPSLHHFQKQLNAPYAFQVVIDMPYVDKNCFLGPEPLIVSARTFLSQLV